MVPYLERLNTLMPVSQGDAAAVFSDTVLPFLIDEWLGAYGPPSGRSEVVETTLDRFSYLFDISEERLIAAWGISAGRDGHERDRSRMAGHPKGGGPHYHRGHAIPHRLGGQTDINLVPQRGSVNVGAFRALENRAVANPGALYFTCWLYDRNAGQQPSAVQQGLLVPGRAAEVIQHRN